MWTPEKASDVRGAFALPRTTKPRRYDYGGTATFHFGGYRPGLRSVVGASATAYGYTLTVGPTSMLLTHGYGPPEPLEVLLFCGGAILAFALVGALAFGGVSGHFGDHPKKIQLWGSFHFLSVGLAVVAAYLVGAFVPSALGWPLGAFAATATYLMVVGFENAAADLERRRS